MKPKSSKFSLWPACALAIACAIQNEGWAAPQTGSSGLAGSETVTALAQSTAAGGGSAAGVATKVEAELAAPALGVAMKSANYSMQSSVVWVEPSLGTQHPVVFGIEPASGMSVGGLPVLLRGLNFQELGSGATTVWFNGVAATDVLVQTDGTISLTTPPGVDALGNSIGLADVAVTNAIGSDSRSNAFMYLPALEMFSPAQVGKFAEIVVRSQPNSLLYLFIGNSVPGVGYAAPPFAGSIAITVNRVQVVTAFPMTTGDLVLAIPIPDIAALVGFSIEMQSLAITNLSPLTGAFSRPLSVTIFN
jgi:hypothetical protein